MAEATDYYQKNLRDIIGGTMPEFKRQRGEQYKFLRNQNLRTGQSSQDAAQAARPFADAAGRAAAKAGVAARGMATQQEQFDTRVKTQAQQWQDQFEQQQEQYESNLAQRKEEQAEVTRRAETQNMMAMFEKTGWTPEMLERLGYSDSQAGSTSFNRQIEDLGFQGPTGQNPGGRGPFGKNNQMLYNRAQMPGSQFSTRSQRNQQAWLQSQFG